MICMDTELHSKRRHWISCDQGLLSDQHQVILVPRGQNPLPISASQLSESALGIATAGAQAGHTRCTGAYSKDTPFSCSPLTSGPKLVCAAEKQSKWGPGQAGGKVTGGRTCNAGRGGCSIDPPSAPDSSLGLRQGKGSLSRGLRAASALSCGAQQELPGPHL